MKQVLIEVLSNIITTLIVIGIYYLVKFLKSLSVSSIKSKRE